MRKNVYLLTVSSITIKIVVQTKLAEIYCSVSLSNYFFLLFLINKHYFIGRTISEDSSTDFCELLLCGSRGVGGVATMSDEGVISMDLLDLEDEEEEEDVDDSYEE